MTVKFSLNIGEVSDLKMVTVREPFFPLSRSRPEGITMHHTTRINSSPGSTLSWTSVDCSVPSILQVYVPESDS